MRATCLAYNAKIAKYPLQRNCAQQIFEIKNGI